MTHRIRAAHFRATDAEGRVWRLTWHPIHATITGRPLHSRTSYTITGHDLTAALLAGAQTGTKAKEDPRQLRFV